MSREKSCSKKTVDRQLGGAAHKRCQKDRHFTVPFGRQGTACHNTRNRTAEADQHRNNAAAGKSNLTEQFIHNKSNSCHVTAVFQKRQEEKECDDDR